MIGNQWLYNTVPFLSRSPSIFESKEMSVVFTLPAIVYTYPVLFECIKVINKNSNVKRGIGDIDMIGFLTR